MSGYSNNWSDDSNFGDEGGNQGGGGLRKLLEQTLEENKKLREAFEGKEREKSTAALLKDKGLDPAIAELIPDGQDAAVWVEKYSHLLGVPQNTEDQREIAPELQVADDSDPAVQLRKQQLAEEQQALADMQDAAESGSPAIQADLLDRMNKIESEDELIKFFNTNGAPVVG